MTDQQPLPSPSEADAPPPPENRWRNEISERVAGYRNKRGRRVEGAYSMRFPFPPASTQDFAPEATQESRQAEQVDSAALAASVATAVEAQPVEIQEPAPPPSMDGNQARRDSMAEENIVAENEVAPLPAYAEADPEPQSAPQHVTRPPAQRKIIAFPRQATLAPETRYRLADPVVPEQPRILDVPEELEAFPCAPLLDGLNLPSNAAQPATPVDHIELPLEPATTSQRVLAGVIDCALIVVAAAIFGAVCYKMLPNLALTKPLLLIAGAIPVLLWAVYQYMLMLYAGATVGMRALHLRLSTFKGGVPKWRHRRSRVVGLYFSAASMMMGLVWALVDVDALCWHDRISRTYLTRQEQSAVQSPD
jgi:uncharacterized RDD family membrane protein YckC